MLYVSSACIKTAKICDAVETLAQEGIRYIELSGGTRYYEGYMQDLMRLKKEYGLQYSSHGYFPPPREDIVVNLAACNDEIYENSIRFYKENIDRLQILGCTELSVHSGFYVEVSAEEIGKRISLTTEYNREKADRRFANAVKELNSVAEKAGMHFFMENNVLSQENFESFGNRNMFMMTGSRDIEEKMRQTGIPLLLDIGHLKVSCHTLKLNLDKELDLLLPQAGWLHLHDNNGSRDQHDRLEAGSGIYEKVHEFVRSSGISATIEVHTGLENTLATYRNFMG